MISGETTKTTMDKWSVAALTVTCGCFFFMGYAVAGPQGVNLVASPVSVRTSTSTQPVMARGPMRASTQMPAAQYYDVAEATEQEEFAPVFAAEAAPATSPNVALIAMGLIVPSLAALYMAIKRTAAAAAPAPLNAVPMYSAPYGSVAPSYGRGRGSALYATPDGAVAEAAPDSEDEGEDEGKGAKGAKGKGKGKGKGENEFKEQVVQIRRVTKVVKGGKQMKFRAVVVVGNGKGKVGVGCASNKEVMGAVAKAVVDAKANLIEVPITKGNTIPHRNDVFLGAAKVMLRPACDGTGVIAGGAVRVVLELAGVQNCLAKQLGTPNALSNARCTIKGLSELRSLKMVAEERDVPLSSLF